MSEPELEFQPDQWIPFTNQERLYEPFDDGRYIVRDYTEVDGEVYLVNQMVTSSVSLPAGAMVPAMKVNERKGAVLPSVSTES